MCKEMGSFRSSDTRTSAGRRRPLATARQQGALCTAWRSLTLAALALPAGFLLRQPTCAAQEYVAIGLTAGETYVLKGLDHNGTPLVRFSDNPHCFVLECAAPGRCSVLAAEAGHGSIRASLEGGEPVVYDVTVSALARPGKPLEPASAPRAIGDFFARKPGNGGNGPIAGSSSATEPAAAGVATVSAVSAGYAGAAPTSRSVGSDAAAVARYTQNPTANELELPSSGTGTTKHYLPARTLKLTSRSSQIFDFMIPLRRVAIADTEVADVEVIGPNQLMLVAHKPGATTLSVWQEDGQYSERPVRVEQGGPQQVQLHVVVAELNRSRLESQGLDISAALANAGVSIVGLQGGVATPYTASTNLISSSGAGTISALPPNGVLPPGGQLVPLLLSSGVTYGFTSVNGQWTTNALFQILEQHDLARILAQPMLIAASGEEAKFLSGGEIPIVIAQALNTSIVFKQFGTSVKFIPTVIDDDEIELVVAPEFSQPDYSQGVQLFGFTVPAFITRRAETMVRLKQNQTLIIAGLVLNNVQSELRKTPYLGDVPYLGYLFKHTYYRRTNSELVMTVTPQIISAIQPATRVPLPTDQGPMSPAEVRTRPLSEPDVSRPRLQ